MQNAKLNTGCWKSTEAYLWNMILNIKTMKKCLCKKTSFEIIAYFSGYKRFSSCSRKIEWYEEW